MICLMQMLTMRLSKVDFWIKVATYGLTFLAIVGSLLPPRHIEPLTFSLSDKLIHGVYYFMLTIGWLSTYAQGNQRKQLYVVFSLLALGLLLECLQALLPIDRKMDGYDLLANGIGIVAASLVVFLWPKVS